MIPYLHLTTRIKGRKYDGLLGEKGFRSFPTLAFMDADGKVVAQPADRTVRGFERVLGFLPTHLDLVARIKAGEKGLEFDLFLSEYNLGRISGEAAVSKAMSFKDLTEQQKARVDQLLLDEEVLRLTKKGMRDQNKLAEVSKRFVEILDEGKLPSKHVMLEFWAIVAYTAEQDGDAELLGRCVAGLRSGFPDRRDVQDWANELALKQKKLAK